MHRDGNDGPSVPRSARGLFKRLFIPTYDEIALFSTSSAVVLLLVFNSDFRSEAYSFLLENMGLRDLVTLLMLVSGLLLAIYHVFATRQKTDIEKLLMLIFVVLANALAGIAAAEYAYESASGIAAIFPAWNFANGILLVFMLRAGIIDENNICDRNVTLAQALFSLVMVAAVFTFSTVVLGLNWALTLSLCVSYASSVNALFQDWVAARLS